LLRHIQGSVTEFVANLQGASLPEDQVVLLSSAKLKCSHGQKGNWAGVGKDTVTEHLTQLHELCADRTKYIFDAVLQKLARSLAEFTAAGADARRRAGELEFHDLLVLARFVLSTSEHAQAVRTALAQRYQRLLLDEFQDTDPIQIALAVLIASPEPVAAQKDWQETVIEPGRSGRSIVDWVNFTFAELIKETPNSQPGYIDLIGLRGRPEIGPAVAFFGTLHDPKPTADEIRQAEANDVAGVILRAIRQKWSVQNPVDQQWRAARWSDIAVLLPARTSLEVLQRALDDANIPYRAETSSLVYGTGEVRDLMMVARAIDDPTDSLAVVSALRTPGFGSGDDDLFTWHSRHRGRWDHQRRMPDGAPACHPVAEGLAWLSEQHRQRLWLSPSQLIERILRERRFFELAADERRPRDLWRRLRFVLDQCRAWEEAGGGTLREYLRWVEGQSAEGARVIETVLPEHDDDAVRILTVHGAKGLEFPIVVLSGLTTAMRAPPSAVEMAFPASQGWAIKLKSKMSTSDFDVHQPVDEQMDADERLRLLYVAATRARDHLVISAHRNLPGNRKPTAAEVLYAAGHRFEGVETLDVSGEAPMPAPP
jgi:ATP-dependent exoDNAse (exonuclease V) beta subunit